MSELPISDAELTRTLRKRIKDSTQELYLGNKEELKALALKEAISYTREVVEEIITDLEKELSADF